MTWVEVVPATATMFLLFCAMKQSVAFHNRFQYRGIFDKRLPYNVHTDDTETSVRLADKDDRIGIVPTEVDWVHPLWRPWNYPEQN